MQNPVVKLRTLSLKMQITSTCSGSTLFCKAAAYALQDINIIVSRRDTPHRVAKLIHQWMLSLLWGLDSLEVLMMPADAAPCPPMLGCLPKLRFFELRLYRPGAWLEHFFVDLSYCSCLEALKLGQPNFDSIYDLYKLPEVHLSAVTNLRRIELTNCFPDATFHLPPECELCVSLMYNKEYPWEDIWTGMQGHLTVLSLSYVGVPRWPAGVELLSRLEYFRMECGSFLGQDLAVLKAIPHVYLEIGNMAEFSLTDGAWQSLEVHGMNGLRLDIKDADAFVRGTKRFLFISSGNLELSQPLFTSVRAACSRQLKSCYQCKHSYPWNDKAHSIRLSNCEEVMRLEPSSDGKLTPSGGLCNGYAGTPETSTLWERLFRKSLVSKEQFWPTWEPHKWVFGE